MHDLAKRWTTASSSSARTSTGLPCGSQLGDIRGVDADLAAVDRLATELRQPQWQWNVPLVRATRAIIDGRFAEAEELSRRAAALGERAEEPVAAQFHTTQIALLRRLRRSPSDDAELAAMLDVLTRSRDPVPGDPGLALVARGEPRRARARARGPGGIRVARRATNFDDVPLDAQWAISLTLLGEVAAYLGDARAGRAPVRDARCPTRAST